MYKGKTTRQGGVSLKHGGSYICVKYWNRNPHTSVDTFSLCDDEYVIDAEGVIHDDSVLHVEYPRRSSRRRGSRRSSGQARVLKLKHVDAVEEAVNNALKELCLNP